MKKTLMGLVFGAAMAALGGTYTWTGGVSSDFATGGNWSGGVAPAATDSDINLVFPNRTSTVSGVPSLTVSTMVLQGGTTDLQFGSAGGSLTVKGVVSGAGGLTVTGAAGADSFVHLYGNNTFSGGYFNNGGRTHIYHGNALGTGRAVFKANSKPNLPLHVNVACTIPNEIVLGAESSANIGSLYAAGDVTFSGAFTFTLDAAYRPGAYYANYRIQSATGKTITFAGPVAVNGGTVLPGNANLRFQKPITGTGALSYNGGWLVELAASGNQLSALDFNSWGVGDATYRISADNPFATPPRYAVYATRAGINGRKALELNGHDVTLAEMYTDGTPIVNPVVTSSQPATLTVSAQSANRTWFGALQDELSFTFDSAGRTLTLTTANSTMKGTLAVRAGTVVADAGAAFPNLGAIEVEDGARLRFTETAGAVAAGVVKVGSSGTLDLGGRSLTVNALFVGGALQAKGTYTAADCAWLEGAGSSITVALDTAVDGYVWLGTAGGAWNNPANWLKDGAVATAAPGSTDTLYIGAAGNATPFRVTQNTALANPVVLGEGLQVFLVDTANTTLTLSGAVSGAGGIDFKSRDSSGYLRLSAANTFAGGVRRNGPGQVQLWHLEGLGTGAFTVLNPNGIVAAYPMSFRAAGTVTNDMTFLAEGQNGNGYNGCIGVSTPEVHLTGAITFAGDTRIAMNAGSKLYFEGETTVNGRLTHNNTAEIFFATPVKSANGNGYLHTDQGHGTWHLQQPGNALKSVYWAGNNTDAKILCEAEQVFPEKAYIQFNASAAHTYVLDLGGFDQTLAYMYDSATQPAQHYVTSATDATLALKPAADYMARAAFTGAAGLDLQAAAGRTFTLAAGTHTTRGKFHVSSGTLKLADGATATQLAALEVAAGAKLVVDASAGLVAAGRLTLAADAALEVGAGQTITVDYAKVGDRLLAAGTYTGVDWFTGAGSVKVVVTADPNLYVWTGDAGGEWNAAGNWSVDGEPAAAAPTADKTLYIGAADEAHPFRVTNPVAIANPIVLGTGQQEFLLGFGDGVLNLTGKITGAGGIRFNSLNNAQYYARLGGAENDFVGGVRRSGAGQLQVFHGNALGVGVVTLDDGSRNGSKIANLPPLYVGQDCTIPNDFVIGSESFTSWNGWWGGASGKTVRFTGTVKFLMLDAALNETRFASASTIHFDGPVVLGGASPSTRFICKAGATAWFHEKIRAEGERRDIYADNGAFTGYLCASSNEVARLYFGGVDNWKWYFQAPDVLPFAQIRVEANPGSNGAVFDLCGNDQHVRDLFYAAPYSGTVRLTSADAATLTVNATANAFFGGRLEGGVSLAYAPTGDFTYALSNAVHTTTGAVTVAGGTLQLKNGAQFPKATGVTVKGGVLELTEAESLSNKTELRIQDGTLRLDGGTTTVANLYFGTSDDKQEAGLWGAPGNTAAKHHDARIAGDGLLRVLRLSGGTVLVFR